VIAESFERIHRSNLVNMGVLPLQFQPSGSAASLGLTGRERYEIVGIAQSLKPGGAITVRAWGDGGTNTEFQTIARIDTPEELVAFRHGGILPYVLRQLVGKHEKHKGHQG
jgi:aconitate hydratase